MRISPINNYQVYNNRLDAKKQNESNPSFQSKFLVTKPLAFAVAGGIIGGLIGLYKEIKEFLNQSADYSDLPDSDLDNDLEIQTGRDRMYG